jgi:hypothetical protein
LNDLQKELGCSCLRQLERRRLQKEVDARFARGLMIRKAPSDAVFVIDDEPKQLI